MAGNGFEFGDLNTAMMAAIMAEQIARSKRLEEAEQLKRLQRLEELEKLKQQTIDAQQRSKTKTTASTTSTTTTTQKTIASKKTSMPHTTLPDLSYSTETILYPDYNPKIDISTTTIKTTESTTTTTKLITAESIANNTTPLAALATVPSLSLLVNSSTTPDGVVSNIENDDWDKANDCADSDIFEQIAIGAVCILFQILLMMAFRLHRKSINIKQKTLFQLIIVMLPFIELISIFMAFNDSFDDSLGAIMIFLILMMSVFLYLSIHMISKTNATIPLADDHNFGGHNLDSKLDLESNMPEITNLTLNDSTLGCGPTGDQLPGDHTLESIKSAEVSFTSKQDFQLKTRTPKQQSSPKPKQSARPPRPSSRVGTPTNGGRSTPTGRKTPNIRNVSLNKSLEKRMNSSKTITISPYPKKLSGTIEPKTKSPKKLPPVRQTKVRQMTETEVERLKTKWNGKYNQEIGQNMETLEVKMTKEKIKSPLVKK